MKAIILTDEQAAELVAEAELGNAPYPVSMLRDIDESVLEGRAHVVEELRAVYRRVMESEGIDPDRIDEVQDAVRFEWYGE